MTNAEIYGALALILMELQKINKQLAEQSAVCYATLEVCND